MAEHPGSVLQREYLRPSGISVAGAAAKLEVSRQTLHNLVSGRANMSVDMALRLESHFERPARYWLLLQIDYDLEVARANRGGGDEALGGSIGQLTLL